jgi:hypothetical protein
MKPSVTVFSNTLTAGGVVYVDLKIDKANAAAVQLFNAYGAPIVDFGGEITGNVVDGDDGTSITFTLSDREIELVPGATIRQTFDLTLEDPDANSRAIVWVVIATQRIRNAIQDLADRGDPLTGIKATQLTITPD